MKSTLMAFPQGKIQDEFLGCRRRERLQPARTTAKNKKGFLGTLYPYKECLARIAPCQTSHWTQARHTSGSPESPALKAALVVWIPACRGNDGLKMYIDAFPQGKIQDEFLGCRRRERLQPARTTPKNKKGFLGTLYPYKECLARIAQCQENPRLKRDIPSLNQNPQP
ncbi:hypothetical protein IFO68_12615 [Photobacterium sp. CAU 1568]|uniref:Uncharacterized protein n=1 Tax=Photobacterium arenosum TaxID=2774143 RepID=A0ABR9BMT5_9GAMM|nr:hypothetical protein [Photobacterium arenosum]MBD8513514.1 hypothetical protein [Photobacterium arenosum]